MASNFYTTRQESDGFLREAGEAGLAVFQGAEAAVQDTYNLLDYASFGTLPDYNERFLGEPEDTGDKLIEGISNFATAFVPISGGLSYLGKATKVGKALGFGAKSGFAFWAKTATAGALTDLVAYGGQEARLSDLVQTIPALENPITDFLASDADDNEAEGRLKNVLEGFILGGAVDLAMAGFKGLKIIRKAASPEEATAALEKAGIGPEALRAVDELGKPTQLDLPYEGDLPGLGFKPKPAPREVAEVFEGEATPFDEGLKTLGLTEQDAQDLVGRINARKGKGLGVNPRNLTEEELDDLILNKKHINLAHFRTEDDVLSLMRASEDLYDRIGAEDLKAPQTWGKQEAEAAEQFQDMVGIQDSSEGLSVLLKEGESLEKDAASVTKRIKAWGFVAMASSRSLNESLKPFIAGGGTDALKGAEAFIQLQAHNRIMATLARTRSVVGRTLNYFKHDVPDVLADPDLAKRIVDEGGGLGAMYKTALQIQAAFGDGGWRGAASVNAMTQLSTGRRLFNAGLEYWMNAILSGPKTATVNALSGALLSVYRPLELMLGSKVAQFLGKGDGREVQEAAMELAGLVHSFKESFQMAKQAFREQRGILSSSGIIDTPVQSQKAISAANAGLDDTSLAGRIANFVGSTVNIPSRLLQSTDEFVKQINYRAVARRQFLQEAASQGFNPLETAEYATRQMTKLVEDGQAFSHETVFRRGLRDADAKGVVNPAARTAWASKYVSDFWQNPLNNADSLSALSKQALGVAEEVTLQTPLAAGSIGARVSATVVANPVLRFVTPFIRTPLNAAKMAGQKMDYLSVLRVIHAKKYGKGLESLAGSKSRLIQDVLSGSSRKRAEAIGRLSAGAGFFFVGISAASQGLITGRGPRDAEQRQTLADSGWLPYSFKVGDKYIQYNRAEPFSVLLGLIGDITDYAKHSTDDDQGPLETVMTGLMVGVANNFTNKTYFTGIRNLIDALSDPERKMEKFIQRYAASLVPNIAGQAVGAAGDENMRELRTYTDAILDRVPGLSQTLPPRRNALGEPVTRIRAAGSKVAGILDWFVPVAWQDVSDDVVYKELRDLGYGFTPPRRVKGGVDLSNYKSASGQDAYDRWGQLQGEVKLGGKTLRQSLRKLIQSEGYQKIPVEGLLDIDSPRISRVKSILSRYQNAAYRQVLKEYPEVHAESQHRLETKSALRKGIVPALL